MPEPSWDPAQIRAFLLGRLPATENAEVNRLIASDPDFALFCASIEDELVTDFVRNQLSPEDRRQFELTYMSSEERLQKVQFARALALSVHRSRRALTRNLLVTCAALAVVILPLSVWLARMRTVAVDLYPGVVRGPGASKIQLFALTRWVRLRLHSHEPGAARAIIRRVESPEDVYAGPVRTEDSVAVWQVPAAKLLPGEYVIHLAPGQPTCETFVVLVEK